MLQEQILETYALFIHHIGMNLNANIQSLEICTIFTQFKLSNNCPSIPSEYNLNIDSEYNSTATFTISTKSQLSQYISWIEHTMESDHFKDKFEDKVNIALTSLNTNHSRRFRRILSNNEFNAIHIEIIDPYNYTTTTTPSSSNNIEIASENVEQTDSTIVALLITRFLYVYFYVYVLVYLLLLCI